MVALVVPVGWFYSRTVGCDIQKVHGPAVPISPSKAEYAGEGLTVSKCGTERCAHLGHGSHAAATFPERLTGFYGAHRHASGFLLEVTNQGVRPRRSLQVTIHHTNAARGTSHNRDSIANMAES